MIPGYEKMEAEEIVEEYRIKMMNEFENLKEDNKAVGGDIKVMFKRMDRLSYHVNNLYYE